MAANGNSGIKFGKKRAMRNLRIIARLDVKAPNLVKGVQLEGLRKLGDPNRFASKYYEDGIDEIYYEDIVASLYGRNSLSQVIEEATKNVFVPITVGGGIRSVEDVEKVLKSGADKVAINTQAIKTPFLISDVSNRFGSQCMVLSVQAKRQLKGWEAYYDNGRERSGLDVLEWVEKGQDLGAGEIVLTSVDNEGTAKGFDLELISEVTERLDIPVIASGGAGDLEHVGTAVKDAKADAVALAHILHYEKFSVGEIRKYCVDQNIPVRTIVDEERTW